MTEPHGSPSRPVARTNARPDGLAAAAVVLPRPVALRVRLAWIALLWERVWPAVVPALGVIALFLGLALLDVLPALPAWLHGLALAIAAAALVGVLWRSFRTWGPPDRRTAERRLEIDNALAHRPLTAIGDRLPPGADDSAMALWALHRQRSLQALAGLRAHGPRFAPLALVPVLARVGAVMLLAIGIAVAGPDAGNRLLRAVQPGFAIDTASRLALDVWITPPGYTRAPPIFLSGGAVPPPAEGDDPSAAPLRVPADSILLAQVQGSGSVPGLRIDDSVVPFEIVEDGVFKISMPITAGSRLAVIRGAVDLAAWPIEIVPDRKPEIDFAAAPTTTERHALRVLFTVRDDYGVNEAMAVIHRAPDSGEFGRPPDDAAAPAPGDGGADAATAGDGAGHTDAARADDTGDDRHADITDLDAPDLDAPDLDAMHAAAEDSIVLPLILPGPGTRDHTGAYYTDLTAHPWAGTPVLIRLEAIDAADQLGRSDAVMLILPERIFNHPVARAIAEQRKRLTTHPEERRDIAGTLHDLSSRPQHFFDDTIVFLALQSAARRLVYDTDPEAIGDVQNLLWDTALRVEDGEVSIAGRELREAQQALQDALARNAPDAELDRLMDELAQAIDRFLDAMQQQMAQNQDNGQPMDPDMMRNLQMVDRQDLMDMLARAREMARTGARDAAQEMLSRLQDMLENLQTMPMQAMQDPRTSEAMEMMRNLQGLTDRQRALMDRTFRESQRDSQQGRIGDPQPSGRPRRGQWPGQTGDAPGGEGRQPGPGNHPAAAAEQEALRRMLGEMMRRLGDMTDTIPQGLGQAERSMRDARQALDQGQPGQAVPHQSDALEQLRQGMDSLADQMMQSFGAGPGSRQQMGQQPLPGEGRDPMGRSTEDSGFGSANDVEIPTDADIQRARDILQELHRRAGQPDRPPVERNYIDRLLERF